LDSNIEGLKNEYKFELEIRSSQVRTSFNNPSSNRPTYKMAATTATAETSAQVIKYSKSCVCRRIKYKYDCDCHQ